MSRIRLIGRSISFVAMSRIFSIIVAFYLFPYILRHSGKEIYGFYLIATTVTGYFGLLDLGVMSSLTKYISEYNGRKDYKGMADIINASFSFYMIVGIVVALLSLICSVYFYRFLRISSENAVIFKQLFMVVGISSVFSWPLRVFRGVIQGMNLWDSDSLINISIQILSVLSTLIIFSSGYGIVHYVIATQVITITGSAVAFYLARIRLGFKIKFPHKDRHTYKVIFNFSIFVFIGSLLNIFLYEVHNIIIGYFISISAVSVFAVAYNMQNYLSVINSAMGGPPWTIASEMEGARDYVGQRKLVFKGTKLMSAVFLPTVIITLFFVEPFINYWMGPGFQESILPARIIIIIWLFFGVSELSSGMISAKGMVKKMLGISLLTVLLNLIICLSLIKVIGILAVALGFTLSSLTISFPLTLRIALKSMDIRWSEYFNKAIKNNLWLYGMAAAIYFFAIRYFYPRNIYYTLFEMGVIYSISLVLYYLFILNREEKRDIAGLIGLENRMHKSVFSK